MQDSPQQRVVNLKRHCRQIHEGVCRAQRTLSTAKGKVATATFRLKTRLRYLQLRDLRAFMAGSTSKSVFSRSRAPILFSAIIYSTALRCR